MRTVTISAGRPYDYHVGVNIMGRVGKRIAAISGQRYRWAVIVTDAVAGGLYAPDVTGSLNAAGFETRTFTFPAGEASKTMDTVLRLVSFLEELGVARTDLLVAVGGGVAGDIAGFAAAIYHRGMDYVSIPTTLVAAVDGAVGGKTGVYGPQGGMLGAYRQPRLVICDVSVFGTLHKDEFSNGVAEIIKYGCIADSDFFRMLETMEIRAQLISIVAKCVQIKEALLVPDEREVTARNLLSFGSKVSRGVVRLSGGMPHGRALAIGMSLTAAAGEAAGVTAAGTSARIRSLLERNFLPVDCPYPPEQLAEACLDEVTEKSEMWDIVLLEKIGKSAVHQMSADRLANLLVSGEEN